METEKTDVHSAGGRDDEKGSPDSAGRTRAPPAPPELRLVLLGRTGSGKSASGNTLLGRRHFETRLGARAVTRACERAEAELGGRRLVVIDTPDLLDTRLCPPDAAAQQALRCVQLSAPGPHAFLLVLPVTRFSDQDRGALDTLRRLFGEAAVRHTLVLFTRGEDLEGQGVDSFLHSADPELRQLVRECGDRHHLFSNRDTPGDRSQVTELLDKIDGVVQESGGFYTRAMSQGTQTTQAEEGEGQGADGSSLPAKRRNSNPFIPPNLGEPLPGPPELRLVLVGKTGVGKSASGNTLLGRPAFRSVLGFASVTAGCEKQRGLIAGRSVAVVDTPGLFDTKQRDEDIRREIGKCVNLSSPGPHAFLLVVKPDRFTQEERRAVEKIQEIFGGGASRYVLVLFTRGDELGDTSLEECFGEAGGDLQQLLAQCGGRYHVLNNKSPEERGQVTSLLDKVDAMVTANGGGCYTNDMYSEVERMIQHRERQLRHQYEAAMHQKEQELRARFQREVEELRRSLEQKLERLEEEGRQRDARMKELEEKHRRERAEFERFYNEKRKSAREEAENSGFTYSFIVGMWEQFRKMAIGGPCIE